MSRYRNKGWIVAVPCAIPGVVGQFISEYQQRMFERVVRTIEKRRQLGEIPDDELILEEYPALKSLDPKHWKDQDHYAVLSLPKLRHRATQDQIKFAYRKAVLKHHPDKRRRKGETCENDSDDYFTCITKAYEILGNADSRRSYDSIDPYFDDSIPSKNFKGDFFKVYGEAFEQNARWSVDLDVPLLGDVWSPIEEVDRFYHFWYNLNSWREYSYLDEENKEKAEDAYERRWMEKQNRAARATRKKEENQRMRQLVDNAYAADPRVKRFKDEQKKKKEEEKAAKAEAVRKANEERLALEREEESKREKERAKEAADKQKKQAEAKKEKEREKKLLKKERTKLKTFCESNNYFCDDDSERVTFMADLNHLYVAFDLMKLQELNNRIDSSKGDGEKFIKDELKKLQDKVHEEKQKHLGKGNRKMQGGPTTNGASKDNKNWPYDDLQLLIKAVNLFPAGTADRWQVVATYVNTHSSVKTRTSKECLSRAKNFKESDLKAEANQKAFAKFKEKHVAETKMATPSDGNISTRFDDARPWSSDEQKKLEQALKTFPKSTEQRWDKIASAVSGRTKKECMIRYKELVEMVQAKKAVNQSAKKS